MKKTLDDYFALSALGIGFFVLFFFGIYRMVTQALIIGAVDLTLSFAVSMIFWQYWKHGHSERINLVFVFSYMTGVFVLLLSRPLEVVYWMYPIIVVTFFLVNVRLALAINILAILTTIGIFLYKVPFETRHISISATLVVLCVFSYAFSARAAHHRKSLKKLATRDSLTNVGNRRSMDEYVNKVTAEFNQHKNPCSLIMLDLDHFKQVNDTYGHSVGDKTLIEFVDILKANIREVDKIYRFGGEEFVIIASQTSLKGAAILAEKIRRSVESKLRANNERTVTVSIGVSEFTSDDEANSWLSRADEALYKAKQTTRNIVVLSKMNKENKLVYKPIITKPSPSIKTRKLKQASQCKSTLDNTIDNQSTFQAASQANQSSLKKEASLS